MSEEDPEVAPRHVCAVCGHVLDLTPFGYQHNLGDLSLWDHPAMPVLATEVTAIESRCDFCYSDNVEWEFPTRPFVIMGQGMGGNWAACDICRNLIVRNEWNALLRRVKVSWESRHGPILPHVAAMHKRLYRTLRAHITGPPIRYEGKKP